MTKKIVLVSVFVLALMGLVSASTHLSEPTYCCERTVGGAYCVNAAQDQCEGGVYKSSPTSCETTSYCSLGTCYDSDEGVCLENTPQTLCEEGGGTWDPRDVGQVPQCQLGCCVVGEQAAFVSLTRCKKLSTFYGVENNYDPTITSELTCIATASAQDVGACVYEHEFERICEFTTRADCGASEEVLVVEKGKEITLSERTFYKDVLCSAEELGTTCARQTDTTCFEGDVYWTDSCGNRENAYSADRGKSWNNGRVLEADEVCSPGSANCGNCDYFAGTQCDAWTGFLGVGKPPGAQHFCRQTTCVDREGNSRINGESWCVYDSFIGGGRDKVGSRHYREICVDGEVRVEACADFRNEVCIGDSIQTDSGDFGTAACRVNRWQDCVLQVDEEDCLNTDRRDCLWLPEIEGMLLGGQGSDAESRTIGFSNPTAGGQAFNNPTAGGGITGNVVVGEPGEATRTFPETGDDGVCVPNFSPGLEFWNENNNQQQCGQASAECVVVYEEGLLGGRKLVEGAECLKEQWALEANRICVALGDCGGYVNFADAYTDDGYQWFQEDFGDDEGEREFSPNAINTIRRGFSGLVIAELEEGR